MSIKTKNAITIILVGFIFFCNLQVNSQNKLIDRKIQYFFSDYFGALDSGFTSTKNSSSTFLIDSAYTNIIQDLKLPQYKNWISSRIFNDNIGRFSGEDYTITIDIYQDITAGYETTIGRNLWVNKKGLFVNGKFGKKIKVHSFLQEGDIYPEPFISDYIIANRTIPGEGEVKTMTGTTPVFDRYNSFGGIEYAASKYVDVTIAHGKNFLGDGYRSLILSDAGANYLFGKMDFHLGEKINYTTIVSEFMDFRPDKWNTGGPVRQKKYGSYHYLDIAVSEKFHLSFYEAIIWAGDSGSRNTIELNYLNPFVVMRPFEFGLGSPDNVLMGTAFKYTPTLNMTFYGQLVITEFKYDELISGNNWWANKYAIQAGAKFHNFKFAKNLFFQVEYNHIRPFTYSHRSSLTSFSNARQPLAHPSGSNLKEAVLIANYRHKRWSINLKSIYKLSGLENSDSTAIGTEVTRSYELRENDYGNIIGQGVSFHQYHNTLTFSFLLNPANMTFIDAGIVNRHQIIDGNNLQQNYIFIGLKAGITNNYYDF